MGVIAAYKGSGPNFTPDQRREGMRDLGQALKAKMTGSPTRDKLLAALELIVLANSGGTATYSLLYEYKEGTTATSLKIGKVKKGKKDDMILCRLDDDSGAKKAILRLKFEQDSKSDEDDFQTNFFMSIQFPNNEDFSNFGYLDAPTADIRFSANPSNPTAAEVENAKLYLAAFKFLSRCK